MPLRLCSETNHESHEGVVVNTLMGNLTTVKRARDIYGKKKSIASEKVTSAALQDFMLTATGKVDVRSIPTYVCLIRDGT